MTHTTSSAGIPERVKAKLQITIRGGHQLALDVNKARLTIDASEAKQAKGASAKTKGKVDTLSVSAEEWQERSEAWANHHSGGYYEDRKFLSELRNWLGLWVGETQIA